MKVFLHNSILQTGSSKFLLKVYFGVYNSNIVKSYGTKLDPDSATYYIWGLIIFIKLLFALLSVLPRGRNNNLIFKEIGWLYAFNTLLLIGYFILTSFTKN